MRHKKKSKTKKSKRSSSKKLSTYLPSSSKIKIDKGSPSSSDERVIKKRRQYNSDNLLAAFNAVKDSSISVNAAAKQFGVPLTTLRDRVDGRISMGVTRTGPPLLMEKDEEAEIVHFLQTMAKYGYRYTRQELSEIATDQAVEKGKRKPYSNGLTTKWVDNFIGRWPCVRDLGCKSKGKTDAEQTVRVYFDEIKKIIDRYKLLEKGDRIFNIMEVNLVTDHGVKNSGNTGHQFVTDNNNMTNTTVIACGSVSGRVLAPFLIFQANRIKPEMMNRVPSNVNASISETGKCCPQIFRRYLNDHFLPQAQRLNNDPILVLMDGSKSHMFVGMSEWGKANNVIFSFVPHHTTHLLQPLEVECGDAIVKKYEQICERQVETHSLFVNRNSIGELACQAYNKAMTRRSLMRSFKKAGVFPEGSSDDSDGEMDTPSSRNDSLFKNQDSDEVEETVFETVFTEDLVVGQNQEVTEEEVVSTQEVPLSEEMVVTRDGQLVLADSHLVIHGGEIFLNSSQHGFSSLQLVQSDQTSLDVKPSTDTLVPENVGLHMSLQENFIDPTLALIKTESGVDRNCDEFGEDNCALSAARTIPLCDLISRHKDKHRHSVIIQRVLDIVEPK